jgi:hypothetical protein
MTFNSLPPLFFTTLEQKIKPELLLIKFNRTGFQISDRIQIKMLIKRIKIAQIHK